MQQLAELDAQIDRVDVRPSRNRKAAARRKVTVRLSEGVCGRLFEPFYTTKTSGIGMGLAICQTIIHGHGGRLWMRANEPRGAVFQFILPAAQRDP